MVAAGPLEFKLADLAQARVFMRERWGSRDKWSERYFRVYDLSVKLELRLATSVLPPYEIDLDQLYNDSTEDYCALSLFSWVKRAAEERERA